MASRLETRSLRYVPGFFFRALVAWRQVKTAPGALGASLVAQPLRRTFWTLSAWESREALYEYARTEPHRSVMTTLRPTMRNSVFTFWTVPVEQLPIRWDDAMARIAEESRKSEATGA
jgi:heme-degrading monooxygenase HmoA